MNLKRQVQDQLLTIMDSIHGLAEKDNYADYKLEYLRELAGLLSAKLSTWY